MPLYEFACTSCKRQFEVMQRFSDDRLTTCETCGGALQKLISAAAFQFKGSGWYATDYANKAEGGKESAPGDGEGGDPMADSGKNTEGDTKADSGKSESSKKDKTSGNAAKKTSKAKDD